VARNWPGLSSEVELLSPLVVTGLPAPAGEVCVVLAIDHHPEVLNVIRVDAMLVIIGKKGSRV
jgi:hypothetical protein